MDSNQVVVICKALVWHRNYTIWCVYSSLCRGNERASSAPRKWSKLYYVEHILRVCVFLWWFHLIFYYLFWCCLIWTVVSAPHCTDWVWIQSSSEHSNYQDCVWAGVCLCVSKWMWDGLNGYKKKKKDHMTVQLVYSSMRTSILGSQFWFSSGMHFGHKIGEKMLLITYSKFFILPIN